MDKSFEIRNNKGDLLRGALSCYDAEIISNFTFDPRALSLAFYDVTLIREDGTGRVGYGVLNMVSESLAKFLMANQEAVLCFYCDDQTDVVRRKSEITPQEYRSQLFSRMYDHYVTVHGIDWLINYKVTIEVGGQPRITHFICRREHSGAVTAIGDLLINVK